MPMANKIFHSDSPRKCQELLQITLLKQAVVEKDLELRNAATSQREAGEVLQSAGARAQRLEQDVASLQARNVALQRAQSAAEAEESESLVQLRQEVCPCAPCHLPFALLSKERPAACLHAQGSAQGTGLETEHGEKGGCLRDMQSLPCWALRVLPVQAAEEAESAADLLQKAEAALEEVARAEAAAAETGDHLC